jgi:hypothetical protein
MNARPDGHTVNPSALTETRRKGWPMTLAGAAPGRAAAAVATVSPRGRLARRATGAGAAPSAAGASGNCWQHRKSARSAEACAYQVPFGIGNER